MKYLLLIYENEKRWETSGYDPKEMAEYRAFGKEFAKAILGGNALKPHAQTQSLITSRPFQQAKMVGVQDDHWSLSASFAVWGASFRGTVFLNAWLLRKSDRLRMFPRLPSTTEAWGLPAFRSFLSGASPLLRERPAGFRW